MLVISQLIFWALNDGKANMMLCLVLIRIKLLVCEGIRCMEKWSVFS